MGQRRAKTGSFEDYLRPVAAGVGPALISRSAFSDISSIAQLLPETLAYNTFGFECRLGEDLPRADFLVLATAASGRDSLASFHLSDTLSTQLKSHPVWERVHDFAACWADPSSPLYRAVDDVWLEFDVNGPPPDVPLPSVFFGLRPVRVADDRVHEEQTAIETAIRLLSGGEVAPRVLETLSECMRALPPYGSVFQVGLMLSRGPAKAVRICIWPRSSEHSSKHLAEYLARVGWRGDEASLHSVLGPLTRLVDRVCLDMDVGASVRPKVGFECYFDRNRQPGCEPRWNAFLDSLVHKGLCTVGKRDALLSYPSHTDEKSAASLWPEALRQASSLLGSRFVSTFVRSLHHVKIVYEPGRPLEAKAYLAGNHLWRVSQG